MKKFIIMFICFGLMGFLVSPILAAPVDLTSWSAYTYDLTGGQSAGNWTLSNNNETATQTINADPSMYLNNLSQTSYQMDGSWRGLSGWDDDFIGFVFGYQNDSHFYIMDWKQGYQSLSPYGTAQEGFTIKKIAANNVLDLTLNDFWSSTNTAHSTILATNYVNNGWVDNVSYNFHLDFNPTPGTFTIKVLQGSTELWNVGITDSSYTYGQFGFYNFSQENVQYSGFEQTGGVIIAPVPEPATLLLLGSGLAGLAFYRRMRK